MRKFMDEDFLLTTSTSKKLFHNYAEKCPVIDFDNYLSAQEIFEHRRYDNLTKLWLDSDPHKQAAMRAGGVDEFYITGVAADYDKFLKFAEILPTMIGAPVYYGTHLELQRIFGIHTPLNKDTAPEIWHKTGELLAKEEYNIVSLLNKMGVAVVCTAVDPAGDLEWHFRCANADKIPIAVLPAFCPDRFVEINEPAWFSGITELGRRYGVIHDWESLKAALRLALDDFCDAGCRTAEHGNVTPVFAGGAPEPIIEKIIHEGRVTDEEAAVFCGALMRFLESEYKTRGIVNLQDDAFCGLGQRAHNIRSIATQIEERMEKRQLAKSIGMLTDSYSVTSLVRHEYYRRILCEKIGLLVESGQYPNDLEFLGEMVQDICWRNAVEYFDFEV